MTQRSPHISFYASQSLDVIAREKASVNELSTLCANLVSSRIPGSALSFADLGEIYVAAVRSAPSHTCYFDSDNSSEQRLKKKAFEEYIRVVFTNVYFDRTLSRLSSESILEKECSVSSQSTRSESDSIQTLLAQDPAEGDDTFYAEIGKAVLRGAKRYVDGTKQRKTEVRVIQRLKYKLDEEYDAVHKEVKKVIARRFSHE